MPETSETKVAERAALDRGYWNLCVDADPNGWWFHRAEWLDYALAYTPGSIDHSHALLEKISEERSRATAIVPLVFGPDNKTPVYGGQVHPAPLTNDDDFTVVHDAPVVLRPGQDAPSYLPDDVEFNEHHTNVVDLLDGDEAAHWARVRKSYHSLIRRAEREYDMTVHSQANVSWALTEQARLLHMAAAGRETRPMKTWVYMDEWMKTGHGVLALARSKATGQLRGFAYAIRYKEWSYWASGATLDKNLQHGLQWTMMNALRCDERTRYYEVGHDADEQDGEKAQGIAFFKSGFGGTRWPVMEMKTCAR